MSSTPHAAEVQSESQAGSQAPATAGRSKRSSRIYGGKTTEQRRSERRAALLDAAYSIAGASGYHAATVRAICKKAGLSERYFYESFESREQILSEMYDTVISGARAAVLRAASAVSIEEMAAAAADRGTLHPIIVACTRAFVYYLTDDPHRANIVVIDSVSVPTNRDGMSIGASTSFSELISEMAGALIGATHPATELFGIGMVGYVSRLLNNWHSDGGTSDPETLVTSIALTFQGMLDRLLSSPELEATAGALPETDPKVIAARIGVDRKRGTPLREAPVQA